MYLRYNQSKHGIIFLDTAPGSLGRLLDTLIPGERGGCYRHKCSDKSNVQSMTRKLFSNEPPGSSPGNLYLTRTPGDFSAGHGQPGVQKHCYCAVTAKRQRHSFPHEPCTLLLTQWARYISFSSKWFSNLSFRRFSPSSGLEIEVSSLKKHERKAPYDSKRTTPRYSARWCAPTSQFNQGTTRFL